MKSEDHMKHSPSREPGAGDRNYIDSVSRETVRGDVKFSWAAIRAAEWSRTMIGQSFVPQCWLSMKRFGHITANLLLMPAAVGLVILCANMTTPSNSALEGDGTSKFRPAAYNAEEIFLPRSLLVEAKDDILQGILRQRDVARLDAYLVRKGLRDAWFLVRFRSIEADGSTWNNTEANFESKRYNVHSASMDEIENRFRNLDVFAAAISRAAGEEPDTIVTAGQAKDETVSIIRFDDARILPIPDEATGLRHIHKNDIDLWRGRAEPGTR